LLKGSLKQSVIHEVETGLGFNFLPVFLGLGILIYFTIPAEPSIYAIVLTVSVLVFLAVKLELQSKLYYFLLCLAVILTGMFFAQSATLLNQTSIIERQTTTQLKGIVLGVDKSRRGASRYLIKPISLEGLEDDEIPRRLRISSVAKHKEILPGETISGLVRVQPVSGPVYPGGYDFSFFAWYEGMGGSGFFMGKPTQKKTTHVLGYSERFTVLVNRMRIAVEKRILQTMPNDTGKIAVALVTGNKTYSLGNPYRDLVHSFSISFFTQSCTAPSNQKMGCLCRFFKRYRVSYVVWSGHCNTTCLGHDFSYAACGVNG